MLTRARLGVGLSLLITLAPEGAHATGLRLVDPEGRPLSGVAIEVFALPEGAGPLATARSRVVRVVTRDDGAAELRLPAVRRLLLVADPPGHSPLVQEVPAGGWRPERLVVSPGKVLEGTLRGPHAAVAGGRVCATWTTDLEAWQRVREWRRCSLTAADGAFRLAGLPASEVEVVAEADGLLPAELRAAAGKPLGIALETGVPVTGRVVEQKGEPIRGAVVEIDGAGRTTTDAKGAFRVASRQLPARLDVTAKGYAPATERLKGETAPEALTIRLRRAERLSGALVGEQSLPIDRAVLWVERRVGAEWRPERHEIDLESGDFAVDLPHPGVYRLTARAEGYRALRVPELEVGAGEERRLGVLAFSRGAGVRGRVVDGVSGEAVAGAQVELVPMGGAFLGAALRGVRHLGVSDSAGAFQVAGADTGRYELRVDRTGFAQQVRDVDLEGDGLDEVGDVALSRGVEVRGRVLDRRGTPRPGVRVELRDPEGSGMESRGERSTDGDGCFSGLLLAPGAYQVRVVGERLLLTQSIEIEAGEEVRELELRGSGVAVRGIVRRGDEPARGGSLSLTSDLDPGLRRGKIVMRSGGELSPSKAVLGAPATLSTEVGEDGSFALADVPSGAVWATYCGGRETDCVTRQVAVPDADDAWLDIGLAGLTLSGRTFEEGAEAGVPATVRVVSALGEVVGTALADDDGRFTLADLAPGRYSLEASAAGYEVAVLAELAVERDGQTVALPMRQGETGALLAELAYEGGAAAAFTPVTLLHQSGRMVRSLPTDAFGQRLFEDLPTGSYVVVWSDALAGAGASELVRVEAGQRATWRRALAPGVPLRLRCEERCGGRPVELLALFPRSGVDLAPYLSGLEVGLRFSPAGELALGRVTPGDYTLLIAAGGRQVQQALAIGPGTGAFALP